MDDHEITARDRLKWWLQLLEWYIKQLLPLTYRTTYTSNGARYFEVWNMWFGRVFNHERYEVRDA